MSADLTPGFADPVAGAQACFRAVLDAMSHPGRMMSVAGVSAPAPICDAAAAVLLTLVDHETPLWLDPDAAAAQAWIAFHTGAPSSAGATPNEALPDRATPDRAPPEGAKPDKTAFVMAMSLPDLAALPAGTYEMPETSATVILQVRALGSGRRFVLEGPGLRSPSALRVDGLPADFVSEWQRNHALFPRGVDLILCSGNALTALPRSVSVSEG